MFCLFGYCFPIYAVLPFIYLVMRCFGWFTTKSLKQLMADFHVNTTLATQVIEVKTKEELVKAFLKGEKEMKHIVVDFHAPWCGPCRTLAPDYDALSAHLKDQAIFLKVDIDQAPLLAKEYGVRVVPTFLCFYKAKDEQVKQLYAGTGEAGLVAILEKYLHFNEENEKEEKKSQ